LSESPRRDFAGPWFSGRRAGWADAGAALMVAIVYIVLTMTTTWMGFTRDESFYFKYSEVYWNWIVELDRADDEAERDRLLSRGEVERVWKQNFEHPPLMKVLFGFSWRYFGQKMRPVELKDDGSFAIGGLSAAEGFDEGDEVELLAPLLMDESGQQRSVMGRLLVEERKGRGAVARLEGNGSEAEEAIAACQAAHESLTKGKTPEYMRGCEARSAQPLQFLSEADAFRFPGALMGGLLVAVLFLFGVEFGGRRLGLVAVAFYAFMPHTFFHAHMTCFDVPIIAISLLVLYSFYRSLGSHRWAVATGVFWGLGLLTKLNAFFLPITLIIWWLGGSFRHFRWRGGLSLPPFPKAFLWMLFLGFPMLFIFWPSLWYDSFHSLGKYMAFHLKHEHYYQYYFGTGYQAPPFPFSFPYVFTAVSTPVVPLLLGVLGVAWIYILTPVRSLLGRFGVGAGGAVGGVSRWGEVGLEPDAPGWGRAWFVLLHLGFPMLLIALPNTPIFGGVKHWMQAYTFASLIGAMLLLRWMALASSLVAWDGGFRRYLKAGVGVLFVVLLLAPGIRDTFRYVEYGTAYYNEFIGGLRGAAEMRMQRQFWSYANRGALEELNRYAPMRATVDYQDATVGTCDMNRFEGLMRGDLKCSVRGATQSVMLFDVEERFSEEEIGYWRRMDTLGPAWEAAVDGVPMVRAYVRGAGYEWMQNKGE